MAKRQKYPWTICKPCWELHYCPYGSLVEFYPLLHPERDIDLKEREARFEELLGEAADGIEDEDAAWEFAQALMYTDPLKWKELVDYDTSGMECNVFGHVCPVFFTAYSGVSETKEKRRPPGRYIPREVMLKVVRRDGQRCQRCWRNVPDNELHFDHVIPVARGGPSTVSNVRVLCQDCNLEKSAHLTDLLEI